MHNETLCNQKGAVLMKEARVKHGVSQQYLADILGVARRTVINWENGFTSPTVTQVIEWFSVLGESPLPAFLSYMYPNSKHTSLSCYRTLQMVSDRFRHFTYEGLEMLLFISSGNYGSSPHAVLNLWTAYCHLPLAARVNLCNAILQQYDLSTQYGNLSLPDVVLPDIASVEAARDKAIQAVKNGKDGY